MGSQHYVIIGNGVAGNEAASKLRERDPDSRITVITAGRLLFYNRYELPRLFHEECDWRDFLVFPPEYYVENRINVRRNNFVTHVDAHAKELHLGHKEVLSYDKLLVASGGGAYLPEDLSEFAPLMNRFHIYRDACRVRDALPKGGKVMMLGGDVLGLDLARNLVSQGFAVTLVTAEQLFWPHIVEDKDRPKFIKALGTMGIEVLEDRKIEHIAEGGHGLSARHVTFSNGEEVFADVVMPFYGLSPAADFMMGSGVDFERGLLVNPSLRTTDASIWAAGDVCQIWSAEENRYRFYYGWKNVRRMGSIAAANMTGGEDVMDTVSDETLRLNKKGHVYSPYWEYQ